MRIDVRADIEGFVADLDDVHRRQLPFAGILAATMSARAARDGLHAEMGRVFDRPTRFTLGSLRVAPATRDDRLAVVFFRDFAEKGTPAGKYLLPQVAGGDRRPKRFENAMRNAGQLGPGEFLVPARGYPLDAHGNLSRGLYQRILTQLRASRDAGQNETAASGARRKRRGGSSFFMPQPGSGLPRGVYERRMGALGGIRGVMMAVGQPRYTARFDFFGVGERIARAVFPRQLFEALRRAVRASNFRGRWR